MKFVGAGYCFILLPRLELCLFRISSCFTAFHYLQQHKIMVRACSNKKYINCSCLHEII
uniref:Uncharacterized protein n=1 Tax=Kalanchoe fedtschenkoi TaxID=63787 RepID=A0A7N0TEJ2_KALFE